MNKTYHQITYTLDSKVIRNSNNPHTVEIKDNRVLSHIESLNINNYFLRKEQLYSCFPNNVEVNCSDAKDVLTLCRSLRLY